MTAVRLALVPGKPIVEQVVFAVQKAVLSGEWRPGQPFPSVRALAAELKIHPNTAHKAVQRLIQERWLEVHPGIGTVVAEPPKARSGDRQRLLQQEVEALVVEARRVGVRLQDLIQAIAREWSKIDHARQANEP
ncbi:MAG: GntR family transcriptional regulator [Steroidobacteraceae bacterium]